MVGIDPEDFVRELARIGPTMGTREAFSLYERVLLGYACMLCYWLHEHEPAQYALAMARLNAEVGRLRRDVDH